ncbi:hypothetical protein HIM_08620 [Hirsutella minnesotensis 3608]|uniref:SET domain-containing protein n=1 Tax=Hirsutella minnesotensis 3608 TaxID=1043627 RepID=A0A0F7ZY77_9HYPO|nr:hypothetical protein HIM_08620 [Hirsutella minnesotensis 3608]
MRAVRGIARGEEVTVPYFDEPWKLHFKPFAARQLILTEMFKSPCLCSLCLKGSSSDEALEEIFILEQTLTSNWKSGTAITTNDALKLIQLYEKEGLEAFIDMAYGHAALAYGAVGDFDAVILYAALALESLSWRMREQQPDNIILQQLIGNLRSQMKID